MFPGLNPKKMQAIMSQMGIKQEEIDAKKVIIEKDNGQIVINNPSVIKINMQGQTNFQISGDVSEQDEKESNSENKTEDDIRTIMEKVGCLEQEARTSYEKAEGDLTEAILNLS